MTTSYKIAAIAKLRAEKKEARKQEAAAAKAAQEAADKAHQENLARIEAKLQRIASGDVELKPKKVTKKKTAKKTTTKKTVAKRGRPKKKK
jgi:hypothetical protein